MRLACIGGPQNGDRKTGTATNSRLWNWLAVPGLPTADTPSPGLPNATGLPVRRVPKTVRQPPFWATPRQSDRATLRSCDYDDREGQIPGLHGERPIVLAFLDDGWGGGARRRGFQRKNTWMRRAGGFAAHLDEVVERRMGARVRIARQRRQKGAIALRRPPA